MNFLYFLIEDISEFKFYHLKNLNQIRKEEENKKFFNNNQ